MNDGRSETILRDGPTAGRRDGRAALEHLTAEAEQIGDSWGSAVLRLIGGLAGLTDERDPGPQLELAEQQFRELDAAAVATWNAAFDTWCAEHRVDPISVVVEAARLGLTDQPFSPY